MSMKKFQITVEFVITSRQTIDAENPGEAMERLVYSLQQDFKRAQIMDFNTGSIEIRKVG